MIIGEKFIWLHFPKCAGTFIESLLKQYFHMDSSIQFDPINPNNVIWHQTVGQREKLLQKTLADKTLICNFRRLPEWVVSRISYEAKRSEQHVSREMFVKGRFFEFDGSESSADKYVERYTERHVMHWIRVEYLKSDFYIAFSNYLNVTSMINSCDFSKKINATEDISHYTHWFNETEIKQLYKSNPKWASLEKRLYGNILASQ